MKTLSMKVKVLPLVAVFLLFLVSSTPAKAAECTEKFRTSFAKSIAARDVAYINMLVAKDNQQTEIARQQALTTALEQRYAASMSASSYVVSMRPTITIELAKQRDKLLKKRTKERDRELKRHEKIVKSAEDTYNRVANKVTNPNCTL
jgi:hypothetical protein